MTTYDFGNLLKEIIFLLYLYFSTNAISKPVHPTNSNKKDSDNFENWLNSQLKSGLKIGGFSASGFFQINKQDFDGINIANAQSIGFDINYNFNKKWKIYSNFLTQLDSSYVGGGLGSLLNVGIITEISKLIKYLLWFVQFDLDSVYPFYRKFAEIHISQFY